MQKIAPLTLAALLCLAPALFPAQAQALDKPETFTAVDTNKDGKISQEEYLANAKERFIRADTSKDGSLSAEEYNAATGQAGNKELWKKLPMGQQGQ